VLKDALLTMRNYCNLQTWPLSLSGRHPDGKGSLNPVHFAMLASTGSPDYAQKIDKELAEAYLRLETKPQTKFVKQFRNAGFLPEKAPEGNWSYNYSCLNVHRRDNWLVTAMGFSRYLWATETYVGANMYGRYLNHGNLQILASGNPVSNVGSGFNQKGWDWNHFPGTTAAVIPLKELRADVKNLDAESGYEEMLLSDEAFAGSLSHRNQQGIFAMKLHENAKYNGSLYARKSYFFFDNRILALGSGIRSALPGKQVHTTLFQVYLPEEKFSLKINGENIPDFPYERQLKNGRNVLSDGLNNYFFVKDGDVEVKKSLQHSFDEETEEPTQNNFALASVNHGMMPENAGYEYMVFVQPEESEMLKLSRTFQSKRKLSYTILQHDTLAHIAKDLISKTTAYAIFNAGKLNAKTEIQNVSLPCLIMTSKQKSNTMTLSVCDPDLRFYEGKAEVVYDSKGKPVERSVYSLSWIDNESIASDLEIQIKGKWKMEGESQYYKIKSTDNQSTIISVKCQHAQSREVFLKRF
jgi:chondroitin-sulfate-ABC endolyase/exolyase